MRPGCAVFVFFAIEKPVRVDRAVLARKENLAPGDFHAEGFGLGGKRCSVEKLEAAGRYRIGRIDKVIQQVHGGVEVFIRAGRQAENHHQQVGNARTVRIFDDSSNRLGGCSFKGYIEQPLRTAFYAPANPSAAGHRKLLQDFGSIVVRRAAHDVEVDFQSLFENLFGKDFHVGGIDVLVGQVKMPDTELLI